MATAHNAANVGDIAKTVIMAGDPLRIKRIAEKYLENFKLVNSVRGMLTYTGTYKGKEVTLMSHGMGMPSAGIYVYELYKFYGVEKIIRIGTCGTYKENIKLLDIILADKSYTESNFAYTLNNEHVNIAYSTKELTKQLEKTANLLNICIKKGDIVSADCFDWYMTDVNKFRERIPNYLNVLGVEMEAFAIFYIAKLLEKEAACLLTVVDSKYEKEQISIENKENSLDKMTLIALESII